VYEAGVFDGPVVREEEASRPTRLAVRLYTVLMYWIAFDWRYSFFRCGHKYLPVYNKWTSHFPAPRLLVKLMRSRF
jgi:hypothetical protein